MSALPQTDKQKFSVGEAIRLCVGYAVGIFLLYALLIQPFYIPSGSMKGTLLVGDRVIVTKFSYGYSQYSIPFQPLSFPGRYFPTSPERGDVVVFRAELDDTDSDFVKRIVGIPGDTIQLINGVVHINGQPVKREPMGDFVGEDACAGGPTTVVTRTKRWKETLPNGVSYATLDCMERGPLDNTPPIIVPAGRYFMMGDNRDNSTDSRVPEPDGFGTIPFENILGRAQIIFFSIAEGEPGWQFLALALDRTLEQAVGGRAMKRASKTSEPPAEAVPAKPMPSTPPAKRRVTRKRTEATTALETAIGYEFKDRDLLERAITHISALGGGSRTGSYQRLEFLGDHVLGLIISDMLFRAFPKADEGELSRRLADLVRRESCAEVARSIALGDALRLGTSESASGGRSRTAILADVCEALVGAVFVDGGYPKAEALVEKLWGERLRAPVKPLRDAKTMLQEWAQARGLPTPSYTEVERTGPHHNPMFRIEVSLPDRASAEGKGRSKRAAEQAAAEAMLKREGIRTDG